jgi:hypothetical protein
MKEGGVAVKRTDRTGGDASPAGLAVAGFADELFSRIDKLKAPDYDPKWKDVNIMSRVPVLDRFQAAQEWLDRTNPGKQSACP